MSVSASNKISSTVEIAGRAGRTPQVGPEPSTASDVSRGLVACSAFLETGIGDAGVTRHDDGRFSLP